MAAYLLLYRPYLDLIDGLCSFTTESCTLSVYIILTVYLWPLDSTSQDFYDLVLMVVVLVTVGLLTLLSTWKMVITLRRIVREYMKEVKRSGQPIMRTVRTFRLSRQKVKASYS